MSQFPQTLNRSSLTGSITAIEPYYENLHGVFDKIWLNVPRLSGKTDTLPLVVAERLLKSSEVSVYDTVVVSGDLRSANLTGGPNVLSIFTYVYSMQKINPDSLQNNNNVDMIGYVCQQPRLYVLNNGRQTSEFMVAHNRGYGKSSYVPVIAWQDQAIATCDLAQGNVIQLHGRFQSRNYLRKQDGQVQERTAFELSLSEWQKIS